MTATMMDVYCGKSLDEIRLQDYCSGRNLPQIHVPSLEHCTGIFDKKKVEIIQL